MKANLRREHGQLNPLLLKRQVDMLIARASRFNTTAATQEAPEIMVTVYYYLSRPYHTILGIETSCDDTSIAVLDVTRGRYHVRSMVTASQVLAHRKTGGVVPEVAAREHAATIMPTLEAALHKAHTNLDGIDAIAVTSVSRTSNRTPRWRGNGADTCLCHREATHRR